MDTNNGFRSNQLIRDPSRSLSATLVSRNVWYSLDTKNYYQILRRYGHGHTSINEHTVRSLESKGFEQLFLWRKIDIEKYFYTPYVTYMCNTTSKIFLTKVL